MPSRRVKSTDMADLQAKRSLALYTTSMMRRLSSPKQISGRALVAAVLAICATGAWAQRDNSTAYDALRLIGNQRDPAYYNRLISITGELGRTQPQRWTLLFFDPNARFGLREIQVQGGYIVGERMPFDEKLSPQAPRLVMDLQKLNLNSDGAFKIANNEAIRVGIGFDSLTYALRRHEVTNTPVWVLDLRDYRRARVGSMLVNAENGAVIRPPTPGTQHTYDSGRIDSRPAPTGRGTPPPGANEGGFVGRTSRTFDKAARTVEKTFLNIGGTLEEFFTGRRTIPSEPN